MSEPRAPRSHAVKIWPKYFAAVIDGTKTFEYRLDDRDYQRGDSVLLKEFDPDSREYTGRSTVREIGFVFRDRDTGFAVFSLLPAVREPCLLASLSSGEAVLDGEFCKLTISGEILYLTFDELRSLTILANSALVRWKQIEPEVEAGR